MVGFQAGVRFPALPFMTSRKTLAIVVLGLVFVAGGASTVLESFGTVSGTADVERPLEIVEVNYDSPVGGEDSGEYIVLKINADSVELSNWDLKTSDSSENRNNVTEGASREFVAFVDNKTVVRNSGELDDAGVKLYDVGNLGLTNSGEVISLSYIPENNALVHKIDYSSSDCSGDEAYNVSQASQNPCGSPLLEVSAE